MTRKEKQKTEGQTENSKMVDSNLIIVIIALNVNGLNSPNKFWIQIQSSITCYS